MPLEEEEEEYDFQVVTDKPEPAFEDLAAVALANTGIDTKDCLRAARAAAEAAAAAQIQVSGSQRLIEADPDKIVYEITVELPDAGLNLMNQPNQSPFMPRRMQPLTPHGDIQHNCAGV